ncbi:hypothetical protein [Pseudomonas sp. HN8-3]|uniref:hypothetical protein n=1 Tax=Pseudomonas sp. HN8-3 TaxID=2886361 RepID=UPI001E37FB2F|nr:hypothetical protein [Pseudomonas sp. HN8-3]UEH06693.1 hypothetical protein LJX92_17220 [Pseudomonas sp. HN8-3]
MKTPILTVAHEFHVQLNHAVFSAEGGVPVHESLDAATDLLSSVVDGLADLMQENSVSTQATLLHFATNSVLALLESIVPSVEPEEPAPRFDSVETVARDSTPAKASRFAITLTNRLDKSLQAIKSLSETLINNGTYKNGAAGGDHPPQIDLLREEGIQTAIKLISDMSRRDMHELASELDIPHE